MPRDELKDIYAELQKGIDQTNDLFVEQFNKEINLFVDKEAKSGEKFILPLKQITKTIPKNEKKRKEELKKKAEAQVEEDSKKEKIALAKKREEDKKQKQAEKSKKLEERKKEQNKKSDVTEKNNKINVKTGNNSEPPQTYKP